LNISIIIDIPNLSPATLEAIERRRDERTTEHKAAKMRGAKAAKKAKRLASYQKLSKNG